MEEIVLNFIMNNVQKIFVMVAIGSIFLWFITVLGLGFDGQASVKTVSLYDSPYHSDFKYYFKKYDRINWLGIIAIFNIAVSVSGFFLFKDKK